MAHTISDARRGELFEYSDDTGRLTMRHQISEGVMIAIYLLWLAAASLPVYARIVKHYAAQGVELHVLGHLAALVVSGLVGIVVVVAMMIVMTLVAVIVDNVQRKIRQMKQDDKSRY